jgi:hypothetical protein
MPANEALLGQFSSTLSAKCNPISHSLVSLISHIQYELKSRDACYSFYLRVPEPHSQRLQGGLRQTAPDFVPFLALT